MYSYGYILWNILGSYIQKNKSASGWYHTAGIQAVNVEGASIDDSMKKAMDLLLGIYIQNDPWWEKSLC